MVQKIQKYFGEVGQELSKVSWPSREQVYGSVGVVLFICLLLSIFILGVDSVLGTIIQAVF